MKTIYKYPLQVTDEQNIEIPIGGEPLSIQVQFDQPCLWVLVDPKAKKEVRTLQIFGTGNPVSDEGEYISTFQMHGGGSLVWHVFIK